MTPREVIVAAMGNANVKAWAQVVRHRESSHDDNAYYMISGGGAITSLDHYPWPDESTTKGWKAVGAGQFIPHTWYGLARQYPKDCDNFGRYAQDFGIVALTAGRGALQDVIAGRIRTAIDKCREEWTSLPGAKENKRYTMEDALAVYAQYGGVWGAVDATLEPDTQPAAPIEDRSTELPTEDNMGDGLVMGLVQALISQFAPVAKQQITQALDKHGADPVATNAILDAVLSAVATATGSNVNVLKTDNKAAIVAVNTVQNDSAMMAQVEADSLAHLDKMVSVLEKLHEMSVQDRTMDEASMNAAQVRGDSSRFDARPDVAKAILFGSGTLLVVEVSVMIAFIISGKPVPDLLLGLFITTATWIMAKGSTLVDYAYGTSRSSTDKDVTIANALAKK